VTPEQRVTAAIDCTPYAKATPDAYATAALDAVRDALASDDPAVVRAMAERMGLTALAEGGALHCCCAWCCTGTPREQRGQGHAGCPS
jgi:hypothetical protein